MLLNGSGNKCDHALDNRERRKSTVGKQTGWVGKVISCKRKAGATQPPKNSSRNLAFSDCTTLLTQEKVLQTKHVQHKQRCSLKLINN